MKARVNWLLTVVIGSLLVGCAPDPTRSVNTVDITNEPQAPRKSDYVNSKAASNYRYGMWLYRQSLIAYIGRLTDYVNQISLSEGYMEGKGKLCIFPYVWQPIVLPDTPAPVTRDPEVVNAILANHVRELRKLIRDTNARYGDCVK